MNDSDDLYLPHEILKLGEDYIDQGQAYYKLALIVENGAKDYAAVEAVKLRIQENDRWIKSRTEKLQVYLEHI